MSKYIILILYSTIETYEQFGKVLFTSAQKLKGKIAQVELPAETDNGKQCFSELEVTALLYIRVHTVIILNCLITEGRYLLVEDFTSATIIRTTQENCDQHIIQLQVWY